MRSTHNIYQSAICKCSWCLMYLILCIKPNISHAVNLVSMYISDQVKEHYMANLKISCGYLWLRYPVWLVNLYINYRLCRRRLCRGLWFLVIHDRLCLCFLVAQFAGSLLYGMGCHRFIHHKSKKYTAVTE